jgi:hypothetical protein
VKIASILLVLLIVALLVPAVSPYSQYLVIAALIVGIALLALSFTGGPKVAPKPAVAEAVKPVAAAPPKGNPQAEVVTLLGIFQEKGRLVDFLMEDITPFSDAEVGSVARAVHQGCKAVLKEHFQIEAISPEGEGATITVPAGYPADEFRLVGNLSGEAPFSGTVVHKGWRTKSVKLPRVLNAGSDRLPVVAPAQIEVK